MRVNNNEMDITNLKGVGIKIQSTYRSSRDRRGIDSMKVERKDVLINGGTTLTRTTTGKEVRNR